MAALNKQQMVALASAMYGLNIPADKATSVIIETQLQLIGNGVGKIIDLVYPPDGESLAVKLHKQINDVKD